MLLIQFSLFNNISQYYFCSLDALKSWFDSYIFVKCILYPPFVVIFEINCSHYPFRATLGGVDFFHFSPK